MFDEDFFAGLTFIKTSTIKASNSANGALTFRLMQGFAVEHGFVNDGTPAKAAISTYEHESPKRRIIELRPVAGGGVVGRDPWGTKADVAKQYSFTTSSWLGMVHMGLGSFKMQELPVYIYQARNDVDRIFIDLDALVFSGEHTEFDLFDLFEKIEGENDEFQAAKSPEQLADEEAQFKQYVQQMADGTFDPNKLPGHVDDPEANHPGGELDFADLEALKRVPDQYLEEELARRNARKAEALAALKKMVGLA